MNSLRSFAAVFALFGALFSGGAGAETKTVVFDFDVKDIVYPGGEDIWRYDLRDDNWNADWWELDKRNSYGGEHKWRYGTLVTDGLKLDSGQELVRDEGWFYGHDMSYLYRDNLYLTSAYYSSYDPSDEAGFRLEVSYGRMSEGYNSVIHLDMVIEQLGAANVDLAQSWLDFGVGPVYMLDVPPLSWSDNSWSWSRWTIDSLTTSESELRSAHIVYTVTTVPEPETYAMLLLGLGLVGVAAKRRRGVISA